MNEQANQNKERSRTVPNQQMKTSKSLSVSSKTTTIIKAESELKKLKHLLAMQKQLHHNHQEYTKITRQIDEFQQQLKRKRQEYINQRLQVIEARKLERQAHNKSSNLTLSMIKEENRKRREKMESIIQMYKDQYEKVYNFNLSKRKKQMKFDIQEIKKHELQYLKHTSRKFSRRIKTQNSEKYIQQNHLFPTQRRSRSPLLCKEDIKLMKIKELVKKRKQYGQNAQRFASNVKIPMALIQKAKHYSRNRGFDDSIEKLQLQKKLMQKPKLNSNLRGSIKSLQKKQIGKIATQASPVRQKLTILENLANGYMIKYQSGHNDALDNMCNASLARAQILLNDI